MTNTDLCGAGDAPLLWDGYIAIDASPHTIRLAHTNPDGLIVNMLETRPDQLHHVLNFVRAVRRHHPGALLTGVRTDRWPPSLRPVLTMEFGPIRWVPDQLVRRTSSEFGRYIRFLRFFRATFIARCAGQSPIATPQQCRAVLTHWRQSVLENVQLEFTDQIDDLPF